jgi:glycosyltransferase involved in cell wall biosynthesis
VQDELRAFDPDLMHIAVPDVLGYRALQYARRAGLPVVASYHTRYETYLKHYWYVAGLKGVIARYLRSFYASCEEVYVPSQSTAEALLANGLKDNFRLWPRGVDANRFHPAKRSDAWRAKYGIGADEIVITQVSRLVREKRLDTLIDSLTQIRTQDIPHRVLIVGDGPDREMAEKGLPGAIFTGFLDGEDLAQAYASSDVFVFPSDTESFGNVTLEAMASGLPCVCADATGSRSLVVPGETGFLAETGDAGAFARQIARLAGDGNLRTRMGAAARARSLEFSWDETLSRILGYYRSVLAPDQTLREAA